MKYIHGFIDGCFDFHYGHINALFQSKTKTQYLHAATHSDEEILKVKHKKSIFSYEDRYAFLKNCKFLHQRR